MVKIVYLADRFRAVAGAGVTFLFIQACLPAPSAANCRGGRNLLQNGGFETPVVPPGSYLTVGSLSGIGAWRITKGNGNDNWTLALNSTRYVTSNGYLMKAHSGRQSLNLAYLGAGVQPGILQTVKTVIGHRYRLDFWVGNIAVAPGYRACIVEVFINGNPLADAYNESGRGTSVQDWEHFSMTFTAWSGSAAVNINDGGPALPPPTQCGLDDVSLVDLGP